MTGQISGGDAIYKISTSGTETLVGSTGTGKLSDLDFTPTPEPATLALAGGGLIGLLPAKRKLA